MRRVKNYSGVEEKKKPKTASGGGFSAYATGDNVGLMAGLAFVFGGVIIAEGIRYGRRVAAQQRGEPVKPYNPWSPVD